MFDEFVTFDIAKKLKDKGFRLPCIANYSNGVLLYNTNQFRGSSVEECLKSFNALNDEENIYVGFKGVIDAPTISQSLKWLREDKGLYVDISLCKKGYYAIVYETNFPENKDYANSWNVDVLSDTYEQNALACIEYVLNNLI